MRRFELSEGTSNKFWQIAREASSVRVQFGRIGTDGQTQLKSFASDDAAQTELEKLVKEKVKKGYTEIGANGGGTAAATPATMAAASPKPKARVKAAAETPPLPTAVPAPALADVAAPSAATSRASATSVRGSIAWTDAALRAASPIRGSDLVPARVPDAKATYAKLAKAMAGVAALIDEGLKRPNANKALMTTARLAFAEDAQPSRLDLEAQAAACALIGRKTSWTDESRVDDFVRFWKAKEGGPFALRALVHALSIPNEGSDKHLAIVEGEPGASQWWRNRETPGWRGLRLVAVLADDAEHAALLSDAETSAREAKADVRAILASAFEHPEWCVADVASMPAGNPPSWFWPLLVSMGSIEDAKALLDKAGTNSWHVATALDELRYDLIARYGESAATVLSSIVTQAGATGVDKMRSLAEALALIVTSDVADFFVKQLAAKDLRAIAAAYLQSHPEVSVVPLAIAATGKGAGAESAKAVLKPIVASSGEAIVTAKAVLGPAAQEVLVQLAEQTRARAEASPDELPRAVRTPPWTTTLKSAAPVILNLAPLAFTESMAWKPGEEEQRRAGGKTLAEQPAAVEDNLTIVRGTSDSKPSPGEHSWNMVNARILAQLPKRELLEVLPTLNFARFSWSYYAVAELLVARHGIEMIDFALRSASVDAVAAVSALVRARSPRVAPLMADAFVRLKKAKANAAEWLLAFPEAAAMGLIPAALAAPGKSRDAAELALRFIAARGHRGTIETVAKQFGPEAEQGVRAVLDFDPLLTFPSKLPKLPPFWNAGAFTRPLLAGGKKALTLSAMDTLGTMLAFTDIDDPYPGIAIVKETCDPRSLADFAWDLFQAWLVAGAPSKEQWAFTALAHFGDDECARKLTPLVRAWPGEAAHARAVVGLDVLARIGTDVALMHLHGIAQKLKFKGLQEKAREKINQIADARGLTAEELADRLVPDLGLDERGTLTLDFGARVFRVTFDESLKPVVMDDGGRRLPDLPKPKLSDDAEKSKEATDIWKALKKDAKAIATGQLLRLEIAMCAQRRWPSDVFRRFLLEHPLLIHVVRRLVWGVYDANDQVVECFRVAEDSSFANAKDDAFELSDDARVGIVHRLDLDDAQAAAWGQILSDYEVLQPFAQLSREIAAPTGAERAEKKLERVVGLTVPTGKVLGLDNRGWRRGPPQDGGVVCWYEKQVTGGMVACLELEPGIFTGMLSESPEQKLGTVTLGKDTYQWSGENAMPLGVLSPIAFSELLRDLESLRS